MKTLITKQSINYSPVEGTIVLIEDGNGKFCAYGMINQVLGNGHFMFADKGGATLSSIEFCDNYIVAEEKKDATFEELLHTAGMTAGYLGLF